VRFLRSVQELRVRILPYNLKRLLLDDPAAIEADVEIFPVGHRLHLVSFFVARIEAVRVRRVAADANPSLVVALFVGDKFFGHAGIVSDFPLLIQADD
jgi:hypothetical protein